MAQEPTTVDRPTTDFDALVRKLETDVRHLRTLGYVCRARAQYGGFIEIFPDSEMFAHQMNDVIPLGYEVGGVFFEPDRKIRFTPV